MAVVVPVVTVTEAGTMTAELLLARLTMTPPLTAAAFSVTVQLSVPTPVIEPLLQLSALNTGTPVPVRLIKVEVPVVELLVKVKDPVSAPPAVGSNCTVSVAVEFGLIVSGKVAPEIVKPAPATVAALTVTAEDPVEERVRVWLAVEFTLTLPNVMLDALTPSVIEAALRVRAVAWDTPAALAPRVADCAVFTAVTLAVKLAELLPAATLVAAGTVTAALLLVRFTVRPPAGAAVFSVTAQLSDPAPVIDPLAQVTLVNLGTPLPCRPIRRRDPLVALLVRSSSPVSEPVAEGSN